MFCRLTKWAVRSDCASALFPRVLGGSGRLLMFLKPQLDDMQMPSYIGRVCWHVASPGFEHSLPFLEGGPHVQTVVRILSNWPLSPASPITV